MKKGIRLYCAHTFLKKLLFKKKNFFLVILFKNNFLLICSTSVTVINP